MSTSPHVVAASLPLWFATMLTAQGLLAPPTPQHQTSDPWLFRSTNDVAIADFNGDGHRDVFFANLDPGAQTCQLMLGGGAWRFTLLQATVPPCSAAVAADLDGDGDSDLVVVAYPSKAVHVHINNGYGWLADDTAGRFPGTYPDARCVALDDIDGDGDVDLVVGHDTTSGLATSQDRLYRNNGLGVFTEGTQGGLPYVNDDTRTLCFVDVDGDGDRDLVTGNYGQNQLALNDGQGHFTGVTATHLPVFGAETRMIAAGDVDGDGDKDLVIGVAAYSPSGSNRLWRNNGAGQFTDVTATQLPGWMGICVALLDADGDADLDLFVAPPSSPSQLFTNNGSGFFANATATFLPAISPSATSLAIADLDADGRHDVVIGTSASYWSPEPTSRNVLLQNLGGSFVERRPPLFEPWGGMLPVRSMRTNSLVLIDHDGDGDQDLFVGNDYGEQNRLYDNEGNGVFTDVTATKLPVDTDNAVEVAAGDVDGDGRRDLVLTNYDGQPNLYLGTAAGGFVNATAGRMPVGTFRSIDVDLADLDGDGDLDIVFGVDGQCRVFRNNGSGVFTDNTQNALPPLTETTVEVHVADFDGDGDRDLVTVAQQNSNLRVYWNNGAGIMTLGNLGLPTGYTHSLVAADFDGDGDTDLFRTTSPNYYYGSPTTAQLLRNNGSGGFQVVSSSLTAPGGETKMVAADLDGDGDLDVAAPTIRSYAGPYVMGEGSEAFVNQGGGAFTRVVLDPTYQYARTAAVGDIDGDGDPDVLIGCKPTVLSQQSLPGQTQLLANRQRHVEITSQPRVGTPFQVRTWSQPPGNPGPMLTATYFGLGLLPVPIPLPPLGTVRLDLNTIVPLAASFTANGSFTNLVTIPPVAALAGMPIYLQALVEGRDALGVPELRITNATGQVIQP